MRAFILHKIKTWRASSEMGVLAVPVIFAAVFFAYSPILTNTFAVMDDWFFLYNSITHQVGTVPLLVGAGRPLNAFLFQIGFSAAGSVEGLVVLRFVTLVGMTILGFGLYLFSRAHRIEFFASMAIAIGVVLLPSFHVYASWAQHFTTPYAGALALLSSFILTPVSKLSGKSRVLAIASSAILLIVSLLIYQPLAMLFWVGILISMASGFDRKSESDCDWSFAGILDVFIVFSLSMIAAFVVFKAGQIVYPSDSSRYGLVKDLYGKIVWFVSEPLANAASLYAVPKSGFVQGVVAAFYLAGILFIGVAQGLRAAVRMTLIVSCAIFLSCVPNLATAENWASYRSTGSLAATLLVSLIMVLRLPIKYMIGRYCRGVLPGALAVFPVAASLVFVVLVISTQSSVSKGFVLPNVIELSNLASFLKEQKSSAADGFPIIVKSSSWKDSNARVLAYDEFGMHSSLQDYYSIVLVKTVLRSMGLFPNAQVTLYSDAGKAGALNSRADALLIDFPKLVTAGRFRSDLSDWNGIGQDVIYAASISDGNWASGIWVNADSPSLFSFTYKQRYDDKILKVGDRLVFNKSGSRAIKKIVSGDGYVKILVEGPPLVPSDGYPNPIRVAR